MSTTTSNTAPRSQITYLALLGCSSAISSPRYTPADDTEQLADRASNRGQANELKAWSVSHSKNVPRESPWMAGVISQAPGILSSRTFISLSALLVTGLGGVLDRTPPGFIVAVPVD